jgi:hypothetical protein
MGRVCSYCNTAIDPSMSKCSNCGAPNEAYVPAASSGGSASGAMPFEAGVRNFGDRVVNSVGISRSGGAPGFLELMIRGAFLDGTAYRYAASDEGGNANAVIAILIPAVAGLVGSLLIGRNVLMFGGYSVMHVIVVAAIGLLATFASFAIMAAVSQAVVNTKLNFGQLLRGLAYAQSPGILAIIPVLGVLLSLWRLVTTIVAIREISGSDLVKSGLLLLVGVVAMIAISALLSPLLFSAMLF